jgi:hypothetical protein
MDNISTFLTKDSGERARFSNGGVRDTQAGKPRFDLLLPKNVPYLDQLLTRAALLMGRGAEKYEDRNWEQFSDQDALDRAKSSALRHLMQLLNDETDEDHAAAVVFNVMVIEYVKGVLAGKWAPLKGKIVLAEVQTKFRYFRHSGRTRLTYKLEGTEMTCKLLSDPFDVWDPSFCTVEELLKDGYEEVSEL